MSSRNRRGSRSFRPSDERLESRLVMSGGASVPAEVKALLDSARGGIPVRPNTPVDQLEAPAANGAFIDPSVHIVSSNRIKVGQKDYVAPYATLNASKGVILVGTGSTIQDSARLVANPTGRSGTTGIFVGDNVLIGDGVVVEGPAAIGIKGGAVTGIGANALIDGAIIEPGAFVGTLARVGPGVTVPTGYEVLPGMNVTTDAEASTPSLGMVVKVTLTSTVVTSTTKEIANSVALAVGYITLYQGNIATGGAASAGPIPSAISAAGSTTYFGALNTVLGASSEPGSKNVTFEPTTGAPTFLSDGKPTAIAINLAYRFPARFIGGVAVGGQSATQVQTALGKGDTVRADEGQPIKIASISSLGNNVTIRSPLGGVQATTTTTVTTSVTDTVTGLTTTTVTTTAVNTPGAPTATVGTTTATTAGINAAGHATTGAVITTIATKSTNLGSITIGKGFGAGSGAVVLGSPTVPVTIGDDVSIGSGAVVSGSTIGDDAVIGNRAYVSDSTIAAGTVVPDGAIIIDNVILGTVQW